MGMDKTELLWRGVWGLDGQDVAGPKPGGVVIFARNLDDNAERGPQRLFDMIQAMQGEWGGACPLAVAIDQEGGMVSRLKKWVGETPPLRQTWLHGGAAECKKWGCLWGRGLSLLGINVDFAPVFDLFDASKSSAMGSRCASEDPTETATAATAFLDGLESTGVRGCLKHFPGLGGTMVDSHLAMPSIEDPLTIEKNVAPFLAAAKPGRLIMVAHLQTPFSDGLPASLHRGHAAENRWGVRGRWIPDDMEMGGCVAPDWRTRAQMAMEAGHIALLVCQTIQAVQQAADALDALDDSLALPALEEFRSLRTELAPLPARFDQEAWDEWTAALNEARDPGLGARG